MYLLGETGNPDELNLDEEKVLSRFADLTSAEFTYLHNQAIVVDAINQILNAHIGDYLIEDVCQFLGIEVSNFEDFTNGYFAYTSYHLNRIKHLETFINATSGS